MGSHQAFSIRKKGDASLVNSEVVMFRKKNPPTALGRNQKPERPHHAVLGLLEHKTRAFARPPFSQPQNDKRKKSR